MMATPNYYLPLITGNMTADVVRDMNALAEATDEAIKQTTGSIEQRITNHTEKSASAAHGKVRKEYLLFSGALASGNATLMIPQEISTLDDFDEIILLGTLNSTSPSTWKHTSETIYPRNIGNTQAVSWSYNFIYAGYSYVDYYWTRFILDKANKKITIIYNRKKNGTGNAEDTLENVVSAVVGVKYE